LIAESSDLRVWIWNLRTRTLIGPPKSARYDPALIRHASLNLVADRRDRETLSDLAALLGRQRPNGQGGMLPVDEIERARLLDKFSRTHTLHSPSDDASRTCWHLAHAEAAEHAMDWEAAVFHWEHAQSLPSEIQNQKPDISLESRLAYGRRAADAVQQAIQDGRSRWSAILPRPPWATAEMLDLESHYTMSLGEPLATKRSAPAFGGWAGGVRILDGTGFDMRGIVRLGGASPIVISVGRTCKRIHFLHASSREVASRGVREPLGRYQVTYASGETTSVNLMNPEDAPPYDAGWFFESVGREWAGTSPGLRCSLVGSGCSAGGGALRQFPYLTRATWELPVKYQDQSVQSIELRAAAADLALLVFAITVE